MSRPTPGAGSRAWCAARSCAVRRSAQSPRGPCSAAARPERPWPPPNTRPAGAGYALVGVSADPLQDPRAFADGEQLTFPLASDTDHSVAEAYGAPRTRAGRTYEACTARRSWWTRTVRCVPPTHLRLSTCGRVDPARPAHLVFHQGEIPFRIVKRSATWQLRTA
ncbi:peroxiredoxin family protein [Georgenia sp. SUBG003]|uniref:peroxiredoxin family protein n=1 Tax=Georgenia sp. SUBG003 TaxID=1497974 RepID=UPI003AB46EF7